MNVPELPAESDRVPPGCRVSGPLTGCRAERRRGGCFGSGLRMPANGPPSNRKGAVSDVRAVGVPDPDHPGIRRPAARLRVVSGCVGALRRLAIKPLAKGLAPPSGTDSRVPGPSQAAGKGQARSSGRAGQSAGSRPPARGERHHQSAGTGGRLHRFSCWLRGSCRRLPCCRSPAFRRTACRVRPKGSSR